MIRVAVVDDHPLVLEGVRSRLEDGERIQVVAALTTWSELLLHPAFPVDVVVLDVALGDEVPLAVKVAAARAAGAAVIILTSSEDPAIAREALDAGALGYLLKTASASALMDAVATAARGEPYLPDDVRALLAVEPLARPELSPQERRALTLYASGLALKTVARQMEVSPETARSYLKRASAKYAEFGIEVRTKVEMHRQARRDGLLDE